MSSSRNQSTPAVSDGDVDLQGDTNACDDRGSTSASAGVQGSGSRDNDYADYHDDDSSDTETLNSDGISPQEHLLGQESSNGGIRRDRVPASLLLSTPPRRRPSLIEEEETNVVKPNDAKPEDEKPVSWFSLPKKSQLAILTIARLSEPLTQTSLQAYLFYQLKSFDPDLPDSIISARAGLLQGCFTFAQFITAMIWGRIADIEFMGRKRVLLIGLFGTSIACVGFGFSRSFVAAAVFRTLGGALNSNVGVMRTMIAELIEEKKYQSRAFLLLPMCFNIGVIIGPILGGVLADPMGSYPGIFGPGSLIGGKGGVWWMRTWPYALPNLISALFIFISTVAVFFGLEETHEIARYRSDWGRKAGKAIRRYWKHGRTHNYRPLDGNHDVHTATNSFDLERSAHGSVPNSPTAVRIPRRKRIPFRQIWTRNVLLTLLTHFVLAMHISAFNALTFVFLPTPRAPEGSRQGFFHFGGGLGMPSSKVGLATAIIGVIGLPLQIFVYPRVNFRMGTLKSLRAFLPFSPFAYVLVPFLVLIPNHAYLVWPALAAVFFLQVISRTFSLPAAIILVNNCVPDPSVLGTVHGVAQSVVSGARTLGPVIGGWGLGMALKYNIVAAIWWALAVEALLGWGLTWTIFEGGVEKKVEQDQERRGEYENQTDR
ncbi:hypothetical protein AJ79_04216 [Helicocarpus griseus UAMH5409]|uniref:Major facilitator superfamily (MFS) profile domain-containing protein n=1 Tax=Helicocarpus griseus UAMH5409 TaxID=1447875 RepID=A0A2B7XV20_9EURO|nr:hypothetical protein AJ79_04216 [Helicocarpus griseus UAMH5409]